MNTEQIVAVQRNHLGDIINFKTSGGRIISYRKAIQEVEQGVLEGLNISPSIEMEIPSLIPLARENFDEFPSIY
ncbi:DUF3892 domain-containing protein [Bacillus sp. 31A1R]|uniref:DUF3892 domain-containing protein n=1 Tax=Robertmurraya mangrovi TaxID=3098077 RepID=A0ABU5J172_9BACI|nr:DUF3892 domain-containing protein [Bacillus sp. 31A1R]MDZ5473165.1 DUF3892 domain-containing protein [Bacillus sp. 31A1R]